MYTFYYILQAKLSLIRLGRALVVTQNYIFYEQILCYELLLFTQKNLCFLTKTNFTISNYFTMYLSRNIQTGQA